MKISKIDWELLDRERITAEEIAINRFATYCRDKRMCDTTANLEQGDDQFYYELDAREVDALLEAFGYKVNEND